MTQTKKRATGARSEQPPEQTPAEPAEQTTPGDDDGHEDDEQPGGGDEQTPAAPPPAEPSEPDGDPAEVQARKLDNAHDKYLRDIRRIVGAEAVAEMDDCPYCNGFALVPGGAAYRTRDDTEACPTCNGLGKMFTGSKVPEQALLPCPDCRDSGYRTKQAPPAAVPLPPPVAQPQLPAQQIHGFMGADGVFHPYTEASVGP